MKSSDVTFWDVVKWQYQRTPVRMAGAVFLLLALICFVIYVFVSSMLFSQWVGEQTESVIQNPDIAGITVEKFDNSNSVLKVSALYSFKAPQAMLDGMLQLCEKYESLGWSLQSSKACREIIDETPKRIKATLDARIERCERYRWLRVNPPYSQECKEFAAVKNAMDISNPMLEGSFSDMGFTFCLNKDVRVNVNAFTPRLHTTVKKQHPWSVKILVLVKTSRIGNIACPNYSGYSSVKKLDSID